MVSEVFVLSMKNWYGGKPKLVSASITIVPEESPKQEALTDWILANSRMFNLHCTLIVSVLEQPKLSSTLTVTVFPFVPGLTRAVEESLIKLGPNKVNSFHV